MKRPGPWRGILVALLILAATAFVGWLRMSETLPTRAAAHGAPTPAASAPAKPPSEAPVRGR